MAAKKKTKKKRTAPSDNRETWLNKCTNALRRKFASHGFPLPENLRMACGFPQKRGKHIGECYISEVSGDRTVEMFICPTLEGDIEVVATLVHELCHAACYNRADMAPSDKDEHWTRRDPRMGHGKLFREIATAMGLTGKMTATVAGPELVEWIEAYCKRVSPYPHASMSLKKKKVGSRLLKGHCEADHADGEGPYIIRITAKQAERVPAICPVCYEETGEIVALKIEWPT